MMFSVAQNCHVFFFVIDEICDFRKFPKTAHSHIFKNYSLESPNINFPDTFLQIDFPCYKGAR